MERIVHFIIPSKPSRIQKFCLTELKNLVPNDVRILVWQDPIDTRDFIFNEYYNRINSGAQYADLLRIELVYRFGGIYLDSDVQVIEEFSPLFELTHFFCSEDGRLLTNAVFGAEKGSPLLKSAIDYLLKNEPDWALPPNITTGPAFFAKIFHSKNLLLLPRETFYPYNWNEKPLKNFKEGIIGVHLWEGSWKKESKFKVHLFGFFQNLRRSIRTYFRTKFLSNQIMQYQLLDLICGGDFVFAITLDKLTEGLINKQVGDFGRCFSYANLKDFLSRLDSNFQMPTHLIDEHFISFLTNNPNLILLKVLVIKFKNIDDIRNIYDLLNLRVFLFEYLLFDFSDLDRSIDFNSEIEKFQYLGFNVKVAYYSTLFFKGKSVFFVLRNERI